MELLINKLCVDVNEDIPTSTTLKANIEGLFVALKASRTEIQTVKIEMEQQIAALQAKLQPEIPPEERAQRATLVTEATNDITTQIAQGTEFFETDAAMF